MKKELKDYLHLYLGCECLLESEANSREPNIKILRSLHFLFGNIHADFGGNTAYEISDIKPILRPLSDMTEEEFEFLYYLSEGIFDYPKQAVKRMSTNEIYLRFGKNLEKIFGYFKLTDADERINCGISFYIRNYLINESLAVDETGIKNHENHFNKESVTIAHNQSEIFLHLLSKRFDLFGLTEAGLAIDKTTM